jgi:hypothetical protein
MAGATAAKTQRMITLPIRHYRLVASVAACLAAGVAAAQPAPAPPPDASGPAAMPSDRATPPQADNQAPADATPAVSASVNTSVTVDASGARHLLISNAPVRDTPDNRAKYGAPLSNAGRHTQPAGN